MEQQYCVIVDAYSTSRYLAEEFIKRGYQCIHVSSPGEKTAFYANSFKPEDFALIIDEKDDLEKIIAQLQPLPIKRVVSGSDPGVAIADEIAHALGLNQNALATSPCRRDKHLMARRLAEHNLVHIADLKSTDAQEITDWANEYHAWPIIIKPIDGAGTEGLSLCNNFEEVCTALDYLLQHRSFLGHRYHQAIAQPFLQGQEYIVNTVSCEGQIYISDIWQANKFHGEKITYDTMILLPSTGEIQNKLKEYMLKVVDVLGFKLGPAHSEVMLTANGPVLIETNGRIMGLGIPNELQKLALNHTQVSLTAEAMVDPKSFAAHTRAPYQLKKNVVCVSHRVLYDNCVVNEAALASIKQLESVSMQKLLVSGAVPKTIDLLTSPGWVLLMHEDMRVIEEDILKIRNIEENHLFLHQKAS